MKANEEAKGETTIGGRRLGIFNGSGENGQQCIQRSYLAIVLSYWPIVLFSQRAIRHSPTCSPTSSDSYSISCLSTHHLLSPSPCTMATLYPPRLAGQFAPGTPSAPGTPVHSIQTLRRKSAGHHGPLTKILVANRGVSRPRLYSIAFWSRLPFRPFNRSDPALLRFKRPYLTSSTSTPTYDSPLMRANRPAGDCDSRLQNGT